MLHSRARAKGFTLVEVIISVALVLIVILGVNQVFGLTSRTVGTGQALSEAERSARTFHTVINEDLKSIELTRAPFLIIDNGTALAFRNAEDYAGDSDFDRSQTAPTAANIRAWTRSEDRNKNGDDTDDQLVSMADRSTRVIRNDRLTFFSRSIGRRQTGDNNTFFVDQKSTEAYISYGILRQPNLADLNNADPTQSLKGGRDPGVVNGSTAQTLDQNNYNFFSSNFILGRNVLLLVEPDSNRKILDQSGNAVYYYGHEGNLTPFISGDVSNPSRATNGTAYDSNKQVQWSYYDLAGTSIDGFRQIVNDYYKTAGTNWYNFLVFGFSGFPSPNKPLTSVGVARTTPCLLQHCSQFIVEYAGDFLTEDVDGNTTAFANGAGGGTDGVIDFNVDPTTKQRSIRWYGFPRNTNEDNDIVKNEDVVPLRDYVGGSGLTFERASIPALRTDYLASSTSVGVTSEYRCIWGPDTTNLPYPKMLRIVIAIDDPKGRLTTPQYFEYIIELP